MPNENCFLKRCYLNSQQKFIQTTSDPVEALLSCICNYYYLCVFGVFRVSVRTKDGSVVGKLTVPKTGDETRESIFFVALDIVFMSGALQVLRCQFPSRLGRFIAFSFITGC